MIAIQNLKKRLEIKIQKKKRFKVLSDFTPKLLFKMIIKNDVFDINC
jgi:hypothetical protein